MDLDDLFPLWGFHSSLNSGEEDQLAVHRLGSPTIDTDKEKHLAKSALVKKGMGEVAALFKKQSVAQPEIIDVAAKVINKPGFSGNVAKMSDYVKNNKVTSLLIAAELGGIADSAVEMIIGNSEEQEQFELQTLWDSLTGGSGKTDAPSSSMTVAQASTLDAISHRGAKDQGDSMSEEQLKLFSRMVDRFGGLDGWQEVFAAIHTVKPGDFITYQRDLRRGEIARGVRR